MESPDRLHAVLVDFENVPDLDLARLQDLPVKVTLLIGKNQKRLDLALVRQIHQLGDRIVLVEVGASGHNALDIVLACYLGQALQADRSSQLHIVSTDKDFDPLVAHLRAQGVAVARVDAISALPFLAGSRRTAKGDPVTTRAGAEAEGRIEKLIRTLATKPASRPKTRARLLGMIKSTHGVPLDKDGQEEMLRELVQRGVITISETGRVSYA